MKLIWSVVLFLLLGTSELFAGNPSFSRLPFLSLAEFPGTGNAAAALNTDGKKEAHTIPTGKAFLRSLLVPGWGEWKAGARTRARVFWISESALAAAFIGFRVYGHLKANDYKAWAAIHAGADFSGKPERFATNISYYHDILEYNEYQRRLRRYDLVYPLTEANWWEWDSAVSRERFNSLRIQSQTAYRNAVIVLGLAFANHVFSGIDAIWATHQHNKRVGAHRASFQFQMGAVPGSRGTLLSLTCRF